VPPIVLIVVKKNTAYRSQKPEVITLEHWNNGTLEQSEWAVFPMNFFHQPGIFSEKPDKQIKGYGHEKMEPGIR
jgi:hypothetical protein